LDDLLRASAELLGKGSFGTTYKAVLEDGTVVAVKRLKEAGTSSKKEYEQKMELIGKLQHHNVLPLRAYYYAKEERLLAYDFQPKGSLYALLHGLLPT
jgi:serine/threonine protein kinase